MRRLLSPLLVPSSALILIGAATAQNVDTNLALAPENSFIAVHVDSVSDFRRSLASNAFVNFVLHQGLLEVLLNYELPKEVFVLLDPNPSAESIAGLDEQWQHVARMLDSLEGEASVYVSATDFDREPTIGFIIEPGAGMRVFTSELKALAAGEEEIQFVERNGLLVGLPRGYVDGDNLLEAGMIFGTERFAIIVGFDATENHTEFERMLGRMSGAAGSSLLDNTRYVEAMHGLTTTGQIDMFMDVAPVVANLVEEATAEGGESLPIDMTPEELLNKIGLPQMRWAAGRIGINSGEKTNTEFIANIPANTLMSQLVDHLGTVPMNLLRNVPADAVAFSAASYDINGLYNDVIVLLDEFSEGMTDMVNAQIEGFTGMLGFDFRSDILEQLTGEVTTFNTAIDAATIDGSLFNIMAEGSGTSPVYVFGVHDGDTIAGAVEELIDFGSMMGEVEVTFDSSEVNGVELYHPAIEMGGMTYGFAEKEGLGIWALGVREDPVSQALMSHPEGWKSVLDDEVFAPLIRDNADAAGIEIARTAETLVSLKRGWSQLAELIDEPEIARLSAHLDTIGEDRIRETFRGVGVQTLERTALGVRMLYLTN